MLLLQTYVSESACNGNALYVIYYISYLHGVQPDSEMTVSLMCRNWHWHLCDKKNYLLEGGDEELGLKYVLTANRISQQV